MGHRDPFSSYHPLVTFLYFALVLVFTMCFLHPVSLCISLLCALAYTVVLSGRKSVRRSMGYMLPMALMATVCNALFSHKGDTLLCRLPTGTVTLESAVFGLATGVMLAAVILWFGCYSAVMTSDKFIYLFGRIIPSLSLVLSMTLSFIPRFKNQFRVVVQAQQSFSRSLTEGKLKARIKRGAKILSIMITWSLENAIETADSMKSRGYGLPGRSAFSVYHFEARDKLALCWLLACGGVIIAGWAMGGIAWTYYPVMSCTLTEPLAVLSQLAYLALSATPVILKGKEDRKWNYSRSTI